jgi:hypothetical protein
MLTLLVAVEARPGRQAIAEPGDPPIVGYFQTLGVTARDEAELRTLIQKHLWSDLGSELVEIAERWTPDFEGTDHDIAEVAGDALAPGIWYVSGRAFFGPEEG